MFLGATRCPWYKMARGAVVVMYCGKNSGQKWVATGSYHSAVFSSGDSGTLEIFDTRDKWTRHFDVTKTVIFTTCYSGGTWRLDSPILLGKQLIRIVVERLRRNYLLGKFAIQSHDNPVTWGPHGTRGGCPTYHSIVGLNSGQQSLATGKPSKA